jgi:hypothetical protein
MTPARRRGPERVAVDMIGQSPDVWPALRERGGEIPGELVGGG